MKMKKLESISTEMAKKYIVGLLEYSRIDSIFDYILYIVKYNKKPVEKQPV